ncbi:MAG: methyltransferase domain-containing protein [Coriobacteriales bacterium]
MNIAAAKKQIKDTVEAYLKKDDAGMYVIEPVHQRPIFMVGAPGIGKTAIMEQVAQELGIGIVSYSMTHHTRQSALGLPRIEEREFDGRSYEATEYTMSEIVSAVYDYIKASGMREGILFLDEINCVSETLYPSMLQFLQYKTFGKHKVPDDWVIVCAGNPPEYNRSVHEFDIVTLDRLRQIDVEPDFPVWKSYASAKGVHPAVTTFLDAKRDCFYKVESRPGGGKSFVTARGWEDLAQIIALYEEMGKAVDRDLIAQYLRDEDIADQFSVYYALFQKYRSDYQVGRILDGTPDDEVYTRARRAEFDERVALMGLLLDALAGECAKAMDLEGIVVEVRDLLREFKVELAQGAGLEDTLIPRLAEREADLARVVEANTMSAAGIRHQRLVIAKLRSLIGACTLERKTAGPEAFELLKALYKEDVDKIAPLVNDADAKMSNAFQFVADVFESREMLIFLAEVTTRQTTTQFISHYGNEAFYQFNDQLQVDASRSRLEERIGQLEGFEESTGDYAATHSVTDGFTAGMRASTGNAYGSTAQAAPLESLNSLLDGSEPKAADAEPERKGPRYGAAELAAYYNGREFEWGFDSLCRMTLDNVSLKGKKVLDVQCRRGKGVYKLSARVGAAGKAIGVDSSQAYIDDAKAYEHDAARRSGLPKSNMSFHVAYPENLLEAGIGSNSLDVVYINNVINLAYNPAEALREFARVLKPGGLLICETAVADRKRDESIIEQARQIGNSIQAGRTQEEFAKLMEEAGFGQAQVVESYGVCCDRGVTEQRQVATVPGDEGTKFTAIAFNARKL